MKTPERRLNNKDTRTTLLLTLNIIHTFASVFIDYFAQANQMFTGYKSAKLDPVWFSCKKLIMYFQQTRLTNSTYNRMT